MTQAPKQPPSPRGGENGASSSCPEKCAGNGAAGNGREPAPNDKNGSKGPASLLPLFGPDSASETAQSFGVVRSLAFVAMTLTVIISVTVALYLGNSARKTLIEKNHSFASLLADNLNNQIYRRFTLPTVSIFGRIALRNPDQYKQLDTVVQSIIMGLHVEDVRIFSHDRTVTYSTNQEELGKSGFGGQSVDAAMAAEGPSFELVAKIPYWRAFLSLSLKPDTFRMRTTYPLRIENRLGASAAEGPIMGVLEFSQDITDDMESAIRFQHLVLGATLLSSGMLLVLLLLLVRRAERALAARMAKEQRLMNELHQHEKLAGMGRVVASIAHEIRNPLGIISSSAELLLKRTKDTSPGTAKILQAIYDEARRLSRTVSDFLDYARPRQPKQELVDAAGVIDQALTFLTPDLAEREIGVVRAGELDVPFWVMGDKDLLYRAFYNIMGNAIQAMGQAGTLTITLGRTEGKPGGVLFVFHDSGPGFPAENLPQLLDPFFTTKDDGTGLGLPIVNTIITSHRGSLVLGNGPDGGAEVRVTLPAADADGVPPQGR